MDGSTLGGGKPTDSTKDLRGNRRSDVRAIHGDVDLNGDLVDRIRGAIGDCVAPIDPEEYARGVAREVTRARAAAR